MGKSANSNWFELARHDKEASELGRKPHNFTVKLSIRKQESWGYSVVKVA